MAINLEQGNRRILVLCLLADLIFIALHSSHIFIGIPRGNIFSTSTEQGYAEIFQYIKEFWIVILMAERSLWHGPLTSITRRLNMAWGLLFFYVLIDDSLQVHETLGTWVAKTIGLARWVGDQFQDVGELCVSLMAGMVLFGLITIIHLQSNRIDRRISNNLGRLFAGLAFFGLAIDSVYSLFPLPIWGIIEDGGEMIMMSFMLNYIFQLPPVSLSLMPPDRVTHSPRIVVDLNLDLNLPWASPPPELTVQTIEPIQGKRSLSSRARR